MIVVWWSWRKNLAKASALYPWSRFTKTIKRLLIIQYKQETTAVQEPRQSLFPRCIVPVLFLWIPSHGHLVCHVICKTSSLSFIVLPPDIAFIYMADMSSMLQFLSTVLPKFELKSWLNLGIATLMCLSKRLIRRKPFTSMGITRWRQPGDFEKPWKPHHLGKTHVSSAAMART